MLQDFELVYEMPKGAKIAFIFELNTNNYPVTLIKHSDTKLKKNNLIIW